MLKIYPGTTLMVEKKLTIFLFELALNSDDELDAKTAQV